MAVKLIQGKQIATASWAQNAVSASYSATASYALNAGGTTIDTGSFATTGSNIFIGNQTVTGSVTATQGFISNWGTNNTKTALFGTNYPSGSNNRQILFNDISNNDFNYQSQSISILANAEEGFNVTLGGDPNGASVSSNISTNLGSSKIENVEGTYFGKIQTDIGIVTLAADNGAYEQVIQLKADNIKLLISDKNTTEANTIELYTDRTYTKKYITTDAGFIGEYLEATSITGSLLGTASFAVSSSRAISSSFATTSSFALNALTASFVTGSNVFGPFGSNSITSASFTVSASRATTSSYALNGGVTQLLAGPNITLSPTDGLGQVTVSALSSGGGGFNTATGSYGSFYDTTTQTNPVANIPRSMSLNTTDITNGVSVSGSTNPFNTYIKTQNAGVYNIQFSAQLDKTDSGADEIVIWLRKNGIDLTDTATTITLTGNNDKQVAAWNWFANSAANDYYQIIWQSADTNVRILAEPADGHPGIPSVIVTANRVDQFLSNTGSFSGSFTGQFTGSLLGTGPISLFKDILSTGSINYTLQQQDTGRILHFTSSTATTITIPPNLQIGSRFEGKQLGTGQLSFVTGSGVTIRTAATENAKAAEQYSVFAIDWIGAEEYMLYGRLEQA